MLYQTHMRRKFGIRYVLYLRNRELERMEERREERRRRRLQEEEKRERERERERIREKNNARPVREAYDYVRPSLRYV